MICAWLLLGLSYGAEMTPQSEMDPELLKPIIFANSLLKSYVMTEDPRELLSFSRISVVMVGPLHESMHRSLSSTQFIDTFELIQTKEILDEDAEEEEGEEEGEEQKLEEEVPSVEIFQSQPIVAPMFEVRMVELPVKSDKSPKIVAFDLPMLRVQVTDLSHAAELAKQYCLGKESVIADRSFTGLHTEIINTLRIDPTKFFVSLHHSPTIQTLRAAQILLREKSCSLLGSIGRPLVEDRWIMTDMIRAQGIEPVLSQLAKSYTGILLDLPLPDTPTEIIYYDAAHRMSIQQFVSESWNIALNQASLIYLSADYLRLNSQLVSRVKSISKPLVIRLSMTSPLKPEWFEWLSTGNATLIGTQEEVTVFWDSLKPYCPTRPCISEAPAVMVDWLGQQGLHIILHSDQLQTIHWASPSQPAQSLHQHFEAPIIDPMGMQEAFCGAVIASLANGRSLSEAVRVGHLMAEEVSRLPGYQLPLYLSIPDYTPQ